ncbi:MAG: DUF3054 domain-containing protein, partial [Caldilineaceae bacterium]|nr:DUF3054 domain-containing protein [Caldilineaceae bacterium]
QSVSKHPVEPGRLPSVPVALVVGDVLALLIFVIIGRLSHGFTSDWLINVARIATPFLIGWFVVAFVVGAYRADLLTSPASMMARAAAAWIVGDLLAFAIRSFVFQNNVTLPFALTSVAFTGLFLLGWRAVYLWLYNRARA